MGCPLCNERSNKDVLVAEDDYSFCIVCKWPLKEGHVLVLPKEHRVHLTELSKDEAKSILDMIHNIKNALKKRYDDEVICVKNNGKHCSQEHLHFHVLVSKGNLRALVSNFENLEYNPEVPDENMKNIRDEIKKVF
jgi:histidine triad (HIT) family protein